MLWLSFFPRVCFFFLQLTGTFVQPHGVLECSRVLWVLTIHMVFFYLQPQCVSSVTLCRLVVPGEGSHTATLQPSKWRATCVSSTQIALWCVQDNRATSFGDMLLSSRRPPCGKIFAPARLTSIKCQNLKHSKPSVVLNNSKTLDSHDRIP